MNEYACCWPDGNCLCVKAKNIQEVGNKFPSANIYSLMGTFESWIRYDPKIDLERP